MKYILTISLLFISLLSFSQTVENIRLSVEGDKVIVQYDLIGKKNWDYIVDIKFKGLTEISPFAISGDVGKGVQRGDNQKIVWDVYQDMDGIQGNLKAVITARSPKVKLGINGPAAALLSVPIPGLGDFFVRDNKWLGVSVLLTEATLFGIIQSKESQWADLESKKQAVGFNSPQWNEYNNEMEEILGSQFKYIVPFLAIWIADIAQVAITGAANQHSERKYLSRLHVEPTLIQTPNGQLTPGMGLTFNLGR
jgi:hypothetical protein